MTDWDSPATVHRFYDAEGQLLYVGASTNLTERLRAHKRDPWWGAVVRTETERHPNLYEALHAETLAIQNPLHNFYERSVPLEPWASTQVMFRRVRNQLQRDLDAMTEPGDGLHEQLQTAITALEEKVEVVIPELRERMRAEWRKNDASASDDTR